MSTFKVGDRVVFNATGDSATVTYVTAPPVDIVIIAYDDGGECSVSPYALTPAPKSVEAGDHVKQTGRSGSLRVITVDPPEVGTALVQGVAGPLRGKRWYVAVDQLEVQP